MTEPKEENPTSLQESTLKHLEAIKIKGKETQKKTEQMECKLCKEKFMTQQTLNEHLNLVHKSPKGLNTDVNKKMKLTIDPLKLEQIELVCKQMQKCIPGYELLELRNLIQPSPDEINNKLNKIVYDIKYAMSTICSNFDVYPFGSCVTGLALNGSDADFYIHTKNSTDDIQTLKHLKSRLWSSRKFSNIVSIFAAKIPLLKCFHNETKLYVDINNANGLACCNSNFIRFIMNFDFRIYPLTVVIKYWAKCHNLTGTGLLSNYCLTILIIFYLQTLKYPILPTVHMFQQNVPEYYIGSWNVAFNTNVPNLNQNQSNIPQLIIGFFNYYNNFDFEKNIICTLYGRVYEKKDFLKIYLVPKEFERMVKHIVYKNGLSLNVYNPMCVQDPFELNRNISNFKINLLNLIKSYFESAVNIISECEANGSPLSVLLARLFTEKPIEKPKHDIFTRTFPINLLPPARYFISNKILNVNSEKLVEMENLWCKKLPDIVIEILTKIYFLKLTINTSANATDSVPSPENNTGSSIIQYYDVYAEYDVWTHRKNSQSTGESLIEEEIKISNIFLENQKKTNIKCILKLVSKNFDNVSFQFLESEKIQDSGLRSLYKCIKRNIRIYLNPYFDDFYKNFT